MLKQSVIGVVVLSLLLCCCSSDYTPPNVKVNTDTIEPQSFLDDLNCGALLYACVAGRTCVSGVCSPAWMSISTTNAPAPRYAAGASWINSRYVVLGGCTTYGETASETSTGAYNPANNTWSSFPSMVSTRAYPAAVGNFVFGGLTSCQNGTTTGPGLEQYSSGSNQWSTVSLSSLPQTYNTSLIWVSLAGLFTYGGGTSSQPAINSGALVTFPLGVPTYNNADCSLSGCERGGPFSIFPDGNYVRVWGGGPYGNAQAGLKYNLLTSTWSSWTVPTGTPDFTVISGNHGVRSADDGRRLYFLNEYSSNVLIYDRVGNNWTTDNSTQPTGFCNEAPPVWTGSELIAWSGDCGGSLSSVGGRYQPPAP